MGNITLITTGLNAALSSAAIVGGAATVGIFADRGRGMGSNPKFVPALDPLPAGPPV